jgi:hypothetical protein
MYQRVVIRLMTTLYFSYSKKMKYYFIKISFSMMAFFLYGISNSKGQIKVSGICLDTETKQPVPFANIFLQKSNLFTDADQNGYFELNSEKNDSIFISCVGYKTYKSSTADFENKTEILLHPLPVILQEIFVGNTKHLSVGNLTAKKTFEMYSESSSRFEIATKITIPDFAKTYRVKTIHIKGAKFNSQNPVRIHLYSVGKYGQPDTDLLKKDIIIFAATTNNNILSIEIGEQNVTLNEGQFFIGIQWLSDNLNSQRINSRKIPFIGPGISCTYSNPKALTYTRDKSNSSLGYKWALSTKNILYPFDYKLPEKITSPLNMLVSCEIEY